MAEVYLMANDYPVSEGSITLPRRGRMVAELRLAASAENQPIKADDPVTLRFQATEDAPAHEIKGTCIFAGFDDGLWRIRAVGGKNRLHTEPRPKYYAGISCKSILSDLLQEIGEKPGKLEVPGAFERYVRIREPGHLALETLLHAKFRQHVWRTNKDGEIDVLMDTYPAVKPLYVSERYPAERRAVCLSRPSLEPGVTLPEVGRLDTVRHVIGKQLRTEVFYL